MSKHSNLKALLGILILLGVLAVGADRGGVALAQHLGQSKLADYGATDPQVKVHDLPALQNLVRTKVDSATATASSIEVPITLGEQRDTLTLRNVTVDARGLTYKPLTEVKKADFKFLLPDSQIQKVIKANGYDLKVHSTTKNVGVSGTLMGIDVTGKLEPGVGAPTADGKPQIDFALTGVDVDLAGLGGALGSGAFEGKYHLPLNDLPAGTSLKSVKPTSGGVQVEGSLTNFQLQ